MKNNKEIPHKVTDQSGRLTTNFQRILDNASHSDIARLLQGIPPKEETILGHLKLELMVVLWSVKNISDFTAFLASVTPILEGTYEYNMERIREYVGEIDSSLFHTYDEAVLNTLSTRGIIYIYFKDYDEAYLNQPLEAD